MFGLLLAAATCTKLTTYAFTHVHYDTIAAPGTAGGRVCLGLTARHGVKLHLPRFSFAKKG